MKKKLLSIILLVTALILVGCGAEESEGEVAGIYMTDGPKYQYQMINADEIMLKYADGRPDKKLSDYNGSYTTDTAVYLGNEVGVYLDGERYSTVVEYVPYTNIDFKRNVDDVSLFILYSRGMETKTDWFEGTITYVDGYVGSIDAKEVELKRNADKLVVKITVWGNDALGYEIVIPEAWDDMNLNEQSQEEINEWYDGLGSGDGSDEPTEGSMSSSVVKDEDYLSSLGISKSEFINHISKVGYFDYKRNDGSGLLNLNDDGVWDIFASDLEQVLKEYDLSGLGAEPSVYVPQLLYVLGYEYESAAVICLQEGVTPDLDIVTVENSDGTVDFKNTSAVSSANKKVTHLPKIKVETQGNYTDAEIQEMIDFYNTYEAFAELDSDVNSWRKWVRENESDNPMYIEAIEKSTALGLEYYVINDVPFYYDKHVEEYGVIIDSYEDLLVVGYIEE